MNDRRWGRGNAVLALCWLAVAGLTWAVVARALHDLGYLPDYEADFSDLMPLVLAVVAGGAIRGYERKNGSG